MILIFDWTRKNSVSFKCGTEIRNLHSDVIVATVSTLLDIEKNIEIHPRQRRNPSSHSIRFRNPEATVAFLTSGTYSIALNLEEEVELSICSGISLDLSELIRFRFGSLIAGLRQKGTVQRLRNHFRGSPIMCVMGNVIQSSHRFSLLLRGQTFV